jgi:hypothetical protein
VRPFLRASRAKLVWALELPLGLALYACAVLALHARGLGATPLLASPGLVVPALVIPPVFYVLVGLVSVRPLSVSRVIIATGAMCGVHAVLVMATGALFVIPDLVDYGAAVAVALWGSPVVTMLQLTAAPLVLARLRALIVQPRPGARGASARRVDTAGRASPVREPAAPTATPSRASSAAVGTARLWVGAPRATAAVVARPIAKTSAASASRPAPVVREPATAAPTAAAATPTAAPRVAPLVISAEATALATSAPVVRTGATPSPAGQPVRRALVNPVEPMVRVAFSRLADQLPVEMFARGRQGLSDMLRPGVSLFVPRGLLLPHLAEGVAPVKWKVVADQFPRDELAFTDAEIAERLPDGSLLLPLDEVLPQIPAELLAAPKQAVVVAQAEELPPPAKTGVDAHEAQEFHVQEPSALVLEPPKPEMAESDEAEPDAAELDGAEHATEEPADAEPEAVEEDAAEIEVADVADAEIEPAEISSVAPAPVAPAPAVPAPTVLTPAAPAPAKPQPPEPEASRPAVVVVQAPKPQSVPEPRQSREANGIAVCHERTAEARRIATLLAPAMNGLEIGERDAGTPLVTAIAPTLSDDAVVATALRVVPWLSDPRLPEPVSQATLAASEATIVLTPFESTRGDALLVAAVASRGSLARLERLSRSAAGEPPSVARNGVRAPEDSDPAHELHPDIVPPSMRELASSFTSVGPVVPAVLRDAAGLFRVCLFGPGALEPAPLARLARDLFGALEGTKIGPLISVTLRLETHRLVVRALGSSGGQTTLLVVVGSKARPGLARLELERVAKVIGG